jgi:hypothetical protein
MQQITAWIITVIIHTYRWDTKRLVKLKKCVWENLLTFQLLNGEQYNTLLRFDRIGRLFFYHENIYKARKDGIGGIPSVDFPALENFVLIAASESRWPKYQSCSCYPCQENLFIRKDVVA